MKIGDRVFVRGYIDEIRKDTVIIRNAGGYFGTIPSEVITGELPSAQPERKKGEWIDKSGGIEGAWNYCSVCGDRQSTYMISARTAERI
jgi:hypothetical protein